MEADLWDRGVWLGDLWTGDFPIRRMAVLASQLPPGARVWGVGQYDAMWTSADHWSAALVDAIRNTNWLLANKDVPKNKQSEFPTPVKRPVDLRSDARKQAKLVSDAKRFQAAWRRRQQQGKVHPDGH